jgi:hypothetical protein
MRDSWPRRARSVSRFWGSEPQPTSSTRITDDFLRLGIEDGIPEGTTLWLFRETLAKAGRIEELFEHLGQHFEIKGYIAWRPGD